MNRYKVISILAVLFSLNFIYAQEDNPFTLTGDANDMLFNSSPSLLTTFDLTDNTIQGSAYIQDNFMPAKLSLPDGTKIFKLRYNAYSDEIEIENQGGNPNALNKNIDNLLIVFVSDDKTYEAIDYIDDKGNINKGYFVHVTSSDNDYQLLMKETVIFIDKKPAKTGYDKTKPAQLKRLDDTYYVSLDNNPAVELPSNKKNLSKVFPEHSKEVLEFIKDNRIKTTKKEDLIKLINYINTL